MSQTDVRRPGLLRSELWTAARLTAALRAVTPALLFGLRLWAAVCLAFYIAFRLELDNPFWAGTSAAVVCQPNLGASLRKGWFRAIGTMVGAVMIVVLTACFVQDRFSFLVGLALWCAACCLVATLLHNFAAYGAALAGYTVAIIASDELGAVGGASGDVFILAVTRATEICIGIVCAGVVLAGTDFGGTRRRLTVQLAELSAETTRALAATFRLVGPEQSESRELRRDLIRRVIALDAVIDQTLGEASDLRAQSSRLYAAVGGLFAALSGWRTAADHLEWLRDDEGRQDAETILGNIPHELRQAEATEWTADPSRMRRLSAATVRALAALPARTPSLRLLADQTAEALMGLRRALDGLLVLSDRSLPIRAPRTVRFQVPDWLPSLVNAARAFVTIVAVELVWIVTEWPNGALAITFAAIAVTLFATKADQAYAAAMGFMIGTCLATAFAAAIAFAVLPRVTTFVGLSLAIGIYLVPVGALMTQSWRTAVFIAMAVNFVPLLAPANQMNYDPQQFYNAALAIVAGVGAAALAFRLLPPPSPALRTRRLLALTLRDLRRLTTGATIPMSNDWESRIYSRLSALPEEADSLQRAQLVAAGSVGAEIISLRRIARRFGRDVGLDAALEGVARGDSAAAAERLARLDRRLAAVPATTPGARSRLRMRGQILAMSETLVRHAAYFDSGAAG
jgi:uncharacterized membrane protein YccC